MADIATLTVRVNAATGELVAELKALQGQVKSSFSELVKGVAVGDFISDSFQKVLGVAKEFTAQVIDMGGKLTDLSAKTKVSTDKLQEWKFAAEQTGSSLDAVTTAATVLGRNLVNDTDKAAEALTGMGLSVDKVLGMDPATRFETVAKAIGAIEDPAQQAAVATALLGKAGVDLIPTLRSFDELTEKARELGIVMSADVVQAADDFGDQMDILKAQGMAVAGEALKPLLPILADMASAFTKLAGDTMPAVGGTISNLGKSFIEFDTNLAKGLRTLAEWSKHLPGANIATEDAAIARYSKTIEENEAKLKSYGQTSENTSNQIAEADAARAVGMAEWNAAVRVMQENQKKATEEAKKLNAERDKLSGQAVLDAATKEAAAIAGMGGAARITATEVDRINKLFTDAIAAAAKMGKAVPASFEAIRLATLKNIEATQSYIGVLGQVQAPKSLPVTEQTERLDTRGLLDTARLREEGQQAARELYGGMADLRPPLGTINIAGAIQDSDDEAEKAARESAAKAGLAYGQTLTQTIIGAIQGGGDIGAAIGAQIGGDILGGLGKSLADPEKGALTKAIGPKLAGMLGGALGPLGALGGQLLGKLGSKLFGGLFGHGEEKKVNDLRDQFVSAAGGLDALNQKAAASGKTLDALLKAKTVKDYEAAVKKLNDAFTETEAKSAALIKTLGTLPPGGLLSRGTIEQLSKLKAGTDEAAAAFEFFKGQTSQAAGGITTFLTNATVSSQQSASALSASLGAIFEDMRLQGMSTGEALTALSPAILALQEQLGKTGFAGNEAFALLSSQAALASDEVAGPLYTAIGGLGDLMGGLANTGRLNQDIFSGLSGEVTDTWKKLEGMGKGGAAGLSLIQPELQEIWELQQDVGYQVDESTQALLDMGLESGIVGDKFRDEQDKMMKAVEKLVERMGDLIDVLATKLPGAAQQGAQDTQGYLDAIEAPDLTVHVGFEYDEYNPPTGDGGGGSSPAPLIGGARGVQGMALVPSRIAVEVDGERIAEAATRYSGRVLSPYGIRTGR